jgi:putative oxidoreductase
MSSDRRISVALLLLRLSVFLVMLMWTLDKFVNPDHAAAVYQNFYLISGLSNQMFYIIGAIQLIIILGFVAGFQKRWTYLLVLFFHAVSTFSSFPKYLAPFDNLLFFAAWPMLAACFTLYYLRDMDTLWTVD